LAQGRSHPAGPRPRLDLTIETGRKAVAERGAVGPNQADGKRRRTLRASPGPPSYRDLTPANVVREREPGSALLIHHNLPPARIDLRLWFEDEVLCRLPTIQTGRPLRKAATHLVAGAINDLGTAADYFSMSAIRAAISCPSQGAACFRSHFRMHLRPRK
jgi:hypothetical protein